MQFQQSKVLNVSNSAFLGTHKAKLKISSSIWQLQCSSSIFQEPNIAKSTSNGLHQFHVHLSTDLYMSEFTKINL